MNYRNLRHLIGEGWGGSTPRRLVLSIEGDDDAGGAGGEPEGGAADPTPEFGDAPDADAPEGGAGDAPAADAGADAPAGDVDPEPAPKSARVPWQTKRIDALTATAKAEREARERLEREAAETKRKLDAYHALYGDAAVPPVTPGAPAASPAATPAGDGRVYTQAEFDAEVANRAKLQTIDSTLNRWFDEGVSTGGEAFKQKLAAAGAAFGSQLIQRVDFFEALTSLPNGAQVYESLAGDLDHFADVLEMNPLQLGMELGRLSTSAAAKPAAKPHRISSAPPPISPISASGGREPDPETETTEQYHERRQRERQARYEAGDQG